MKLVRAVIMGLIPLPSEVAAVFFELKAYTDGKISHTVVETRDCRTDSHPRMPFVFKVNVLASRN